MPLEIAAKAANNTMPTTICLFLKRKKLIWTALLQLS